MATFGPKKGTRPSGRQKGTPNKSTLARVGGDDDVANIVKLARKHCPQALETLVHLMQNSENESVRSRCAESILDRGYGRPAQAMMVSGDPAGPPIDHKITVEFVSASKDPER